MIEGFAREMPEEEMLKAILFAHEHIRRIVEAIEQFRTQHPDMRIKIVGYNSSEIAELVSQGGDQILERLAKLGVVFVVYHPGAGHLTIPLQDIATYQDNPLAYAAAKCFVSEEQYRHWLAHYQQPTCDASLPSGAQRRSIHLRSLLGRGLARPPAARSSMAEVEQANTQRNISNAGSQPWLGGAAGPKNTLYGVPGYQPQRLAEALRRGRVNPAERRNWACRYPCSETV